MTTPACAYVVPTYPDETKARVFFRQTPTDVPHVRGPMPYPMAVSMCGWMNGREWLTEAEYADVAKWGA